MSEVYMQLTPRVLWEHGSEIPLEIQPGLPKTVKYIIIIVVVIVIVIITIVFTIMAQPVFAN